MLADVAAAVDVAAAAVDVAAAAGQYCYSNCGITRKHGVVEGGHYSEPYGNILHHVHSQVLHIVGICP